LSKAQITYVNTVLPAAGGLYQLELFESAGNVLVFENAIGVALQAFLMEDVLFGTGIGLSIKSMRLNPDVQKFGWSLDFPLLFAEVKANLHKFKDSSP